MAIHQRNTRREIREAIKRARFSKNARRAEEILIRAIRYSRLFRKRPPKIDYHEGLKINLPLRQDLKSRDFKHHQRTLVINALFRAWQLGFDEEPIINNRGNDSRPFLTFAEDILIGEEIYNTIDNLDAYRSLRKKLLNQDDS